MARKNRHEGSGLDSMFEELGELGAVREVALRKTLVAERRNARRDAEAERDSKASVAIPLDEAFERLHDLIDGVKRPKPKPRKL
jgi:hypothetical protein